MKDYTPTEEDFESNMKAVCEYYMEKYETRDPVQLVAYALGVKDPFPYLEHRESEDTELARKHEAFRKKQYRIKLG